MKKVVNIMGVLLMTCLLLIGYSNEQYIEKYYLIEGSNSDWSLGKCVIKVQNGRLLFQNGNLSVNNKVELFEISIYQHNKDGNDDIIFGESYSLCEGIKLYKNLKDIEIKKKNIDTNYELKAEVKVKGGMQSNEEKIYKLLVKEIESEH